MDVLGPLNHPLFQKTKNKTTIGVYFDQPFQMTIPGGDVHDLQTPKLTPGPNGYQVIRWDCMSNHTPVGYLRYGEL